MLAHVSPAPPRAPRHASLLSSSTRGMTLVEILVVLAIIGLIMGGVAVVAGNAFIGAQQKEVRNRIPKLVGIVEMYRLSHAGRCPADLKELKRRRLVRAEPKDPWGTEFQLECPNERGDITITSAGPDTEFGNDDDISSADTQERDDETRA